MLFSLRHIDYKLELITIRTWGVHVCMFNSDITFNQSSPIIHLQYIMTHNNYLLELQWPELFNINNLNAMFFSVNFVSLCSLNKRQYVWFRGGMFDLDAINELQIVCLILSRQQVWLSAHKVLYRNQCNGQIFELSRVACTW